MSVYRLEYVERGTELLKERYVDISRKTDILSWVNCMLGVGALYLKSIEKEDVWNYSLNHKLRVNKTINKE